MSPVQVLTTVNAPYSKQLNADALVRCLLDPAEAEKYPGHMSSFFVEVDPQLQVEFAHLFKVTDEQLTAAAKAFSKFSGHTLAK